MAPLSKRRLEKTRRGSHYPTSHALLASIVAVCACAIAYVGSQFQLLATTADKVKNKLSHSQHLDQATWATRTWTTLTCQRISVALHIACAWEVTQELSAAAAAAGGA